MLYVLCHGPTRGFKVLLLFMLIGKRRILKSSTSTCYQKKNTSIICNLIVFICNCTLWNHFCRFYSFHSNSLARCKKAEATVFVEFYIIRLRHIHSLPLCKKKKEHDYTLARSANSRMASCSPAGNADGPEDEFRPLDRAPPPCARHSCIFPMATRLQPSSLHLTPPPCCSKTHVFFNSKKKKNQMDD